MKRKIIKSIFACLVLGLLSSNVLAEEKDNTKNNIVKDSILDKKEIKGNYILNTGKIEEVSKYEKNISILVKADKEDKYGKIFNIYEETLVLDIETMDKIDPKKLKVGDKIKVYYGVNTPSLKSLPEQISPEVIILLKDDDTTTSVYVDNFDKNGLSSDKNIKISSLEKAEIFDKDGKNIKKDKVLGKNLIIFYSVTTRSLPPQTAPKKVIVLENKNIIEDKEDNEKEDKLKTTENSINNIINNIKEDNIFKKEKKSFVPVYLVAENLGYNIKWEENDKKIIIEKDTSKYILEIGSKEYTINSKKEQFKEAPFIKNNRTYVEEEFIETLLK